MADLLHHLTARNISPEPVTLETELRDCLHPIDRAYSLRHWLEELTGEEPTEEAMHKMETAADAVAWVERRVSA